MKDIVENVKQTIAQKEFLWAYPIVLKLQKYHYSFVIKWVVECIKIYSSEFNPDKLSQLNKYIQQLIEEQNILTSSQCREIAKKLWYSLEREEIQTAISRMFWSVAVFKDGEDYDGVIEAVMAVELLLPDIFNGLLLDRYLEVAVRICEE